MLPTSLADAVGALAADGFYRKAFGGTLVDYLLMMKRARIHGSTLRARPLEQKAATARAMERSVLPQLAAGTVHVPVAEAYPLADAPAAYDHFRRGGKLGKDGSASIPVGSRAALGHGPSTFRVLILA